MRLCYNDAVSPEMKKFLLSLPQTPSDAADEPVTPEQHKFNCIFCIVLLIVVIVCAFIDLLS